MKVIDLTHTIKENMPVYPGTEPPCLDPANTYEIPCSYLLLGAGTSAENPLFGKPMHNDHVVFNEDIMPLGSAALATCATEWLANN